MLIIAHTHARNNEETRVPMNCIGLDCAEVASKNIECLPLWWLISEEPVVKYYPGVAGSLQSQGESECTEERTAAM